MVIAELGQCRSAKRRSCSRLHANNLDMAADMIAAQGTSVHVSTLPADSVTNWQQALMAHAVKDKGLKTDNGYCHWHAYCFLLWPARPSTRHADTTHPCVYTYLQH